MRGVGQRGPGMRSMGARGADPRGADGLSGAHLAARVLPHGCRHGGGRRGMGPSCRQAGARRPGPPTAGLRASLLRAASPTVGWAGGAASASAGKDAGPTGSAAGDPAAPSAQDEAQSRAFFAFDTLVQITAYGADEALFDHIASDCARYEQLFSAHLDDSDISRINAAGGSPTEVDPRHSRSPRAGARAVRAHRRRLRRDDRGGEPSVGLRERYEAR